MNKLTRERYPASKLPEALREGVDPGCTVTVTMEDLKRPGHVMTLNEIFAARRPPYRTAEKIVASIPQLRDGWDD